ncbi:hypothetical protein NCZ17_06795 [Acinetobacter modestus]|uniref:hypothetical protein n=1 Tax=Acinetobacter modestus TaxID=1776740 RepID=UPI00202E83C8|nr:hypothetical protein [Acinetobacter modestus]MCM1959079.1 hypothetical protein [Acinetobacter modestus]
MNHSTGKVVAITDSSISQAATQQLAISDINKDMLISAENVIGALFAEETLQ